MQLGAEACMRAEALDHPALHCFVRPSYCVLCFPVMCFTCAVQTVVLHIWVLVIDQVLTLVEKEQEGRAKKTV